MRPLSLFQPRPGRLVTAKPWVLTSPARIARHQPFHYLPRSETPLLGNSCFGAACARPTHSPDHCAFFIGTELLGFPFRPTRFLLVRVLDHSKQPLRRIRPGVAGAGAGGMGCVTLGDVACNSSVNRTVPATYQIEKPGLRRPRPRGHGSRTGFRFDRGRRDQHHWRRHRDVRESAAILPPDRSYDWPTSLLAGCERIPVIRSRS